MIKVQLRQLEILKSLLYSSTPRSIESMMSEWSVSERTIKYDLSQIRSEIKQLQVKLLNKKGIGYYFSPDDKPHLIDHYSFSDIENKTEQTLNNIVLYCLFVENPANLSEIAEHLYFDVSSIKRYVEEFIMSTATDEVQLEIVDGAKLLVIGSEWTVRKLYSSLIQQELKGSHRNELKLRLQSALPLYEKKLANLWINKMEENLKKTISKHNIWISESAFEYLGIYLFVMYIQNEQSKLKQCKNDVYMQIEDDRLINDDLLKFNGEKIFAEELLKQINWGKTNQKEIEALVRVMLEHNVFSEQALDKNEEAHLNKVIEKMLAALTKGTKNQLYDLDMLASDLRPHLKHIIRKKNIRWKSKS